MNVPTTTNRGTAYSALGVGIAGGLAIHGDLSEILVFGGIYFILGGVVLLIIAVAGNISEKLEADKKRRVAIGGVGLILLVMGVIVGAGAGGLWGPGGGPAATSPPTADEPTASPPASTPEHEVTSISMDPSSPATLNPDERVEVTFDYRTAEDGVRIFVRPLNDGERPSGYSAHGSPVYSERTGSGSGWFSFDSEAEVDEIRIQMWDEAQEELLFELTIPVDYIWTD